MLFSTVSVLVVAQSSSEIPEGLMNNPVYIYIYPCHCVLDTVSWVELYLPQVSSLCSAILSYSTMF